jgi:hypothetical protein
MNFQLIISSLLFPNVCTGFFPAATRAHQSRAANRPNDRLFANLQTQSYTDTDKIVQKQIDEYLEARRSKRQIDEYLRAVDPSSLDSRTSAIQSQQKDVKTEAKNLMQKIKDSGIAGIVSFGMVQLTFWALSFPLVVIAFYQVTGHLPDFSDQKDLEKLGVEAFTYLNIARLAAPFRIGLSLSLVPWIQSNFVDRFQKR